MAKGKKQKKAKATERKAFAKDVAVNFKVSDFDFLIIKRQNGIEDTTPVTVAEFKKMYQKLLEGR